jgi:hypothetical protein
MELITLVNSVNSKVFKTDSSLLCIAYFIHSIVRVYSTPDNVYNLFLLSMKINNTANSRALNTPHRYSTDRQQNSTRLQ